MALLDLLLGSSGDDNIEGFLSHFFGAQPNDGFQGQDSPLAFGGIPLRAPVLPGPRYFDPRGNPRSWLEEVEGKDFATDPALYTAIDSGAPRVRRRAGGRLQAHGLGGGIDAPTWRLDRERYSRRA